MPDWSKSMSQSFEFYTVDPVTWMNSKLLDNVKNCSITRDSTMSLLESATIDIEDITGECYIRAYLITNQNGSKERFALGTFLVQTPSISFDGKVQTISLDAYSPLIELKDNYPDIGFVVPKQSNIMDTVYNLAKEYMRSPVVKPESPLLLANSYTADAEDTWLDTITNIADNASYKLAFDDMDRLIFSVDQDIDKMKPIWDYNDDNSSIIYPDVTLDRDLYGVPNVVEVNYSGSEGNFYSKVINDDVNSPISTVNRGRIVLYRDTNPSVNMTSSTSINQSTIDDYAEKLLKDLSALEYTVTYKHGYCPVRVGDCVRLNYSAAGINNVKAKVISQQISCTKGCPVQEKAIFTSKLWGETS